MAGERTGLDCKAYRNTGSWGAPAWDEVPQFRDVSYDDERGQADVSSRGSKFRTTKGTLRDVTIEGELIWQRGNAVLTAIRQAYEAGNTVELAFMDGDITVTGAEGPHAHWEIVKFGRNEPLEEGVVVPITMKPGPYPAGEEPEWLIS